MEEKINELETRLEKLEKVEKRRKIKSIIVLSIYGVIILTVVVSCFYVYSKIKPYKEKIDKLQDFGSSLKRDDIVGGNDSLNIDDYFNYFFGF